MNKFPICIPMVLEVLAPLQLTEMGYAWWHMLGSTRQHNTCAATMVEHKLEVTSGVIFVVLCLLLALSSIAAYSFADCFS